MLIYYFFLGFLILALLWLLEDGDDDDGDGGELRKVVDFFSPQKPVLERVLVKVDHL